MRHLASVAQLGETGWRMLSSPPRVPELVAPAGNPAKLRTALHFGADAVYLGLKRFSLRAHAGNFEEEELVWALEYAHERGARVYVTLNVQPFDDELDEIEATLCRLRRLRPDAVVVGDPGVLAIARRVAPDLRLHLSTQASVTNRSAANHWFGQGIHRIVLARELSLTQLRELHGRSTGEFEVFAHGALCVAVSGRCFMSLYWAGPQRDPRHGNCAQPCRWPYQAVTLEETRYPGRTHTLEEDERGTYFFDSRDLCALPVLDRLIDTGVHALKLEGRSRSLHYVGTVVDVYRQALNAYAQGAPPSESTLRLFMNELERSSKRGFSTHFLDGQANDPASYQPHGGSPGAGEAQLIGCVQASHSDGLDIQLETTLRPGSHLEVRDHGLQSETCVIESLWTPAGQQLDLGRRGDRIRLPGRFRAEPGALVRAALEPKYDAGADPTRGAS